MHTQIWCRARTINFYNRSRRSEQQPERTRRRDTVKHPALRERGLPCWKSAGGCYIQRTRGYRRRRTDGTSIVRNTAGLVHTYLGLQAGPLLPPAKRFSSDTPGSALRNLSPFLYTGDKVDVISTTAPCVSAGLQIIPSPISQETSSSVQTACAESSQVTASLSSCRSERASPQSGPWLVSLSFALILLMTGRVRALPTWTGRSAQAAGGCVFVPVRLVQGERSEMETKCGRSVCESAGAPCVWCGELSGGISKWCQQSVTKRTSAAILNPHSHRRPIRARCSFKG